MFTRTEPPSPTSPARHSSLVLFFLPTSTVPTNCGQRHHSQDEKVNLPGEQLDRFSSTNQLVPSQKTCCQSPLRLRRLMIIKCHLPAGVYCAALGQCVFVVRCWQRGLQLSFTEWVSRGAAGVSNGGAGETEQCSNGLLIGNLH